MTAESMTYGNVAPRLVENGYTRPLPIRRGGKAPAVSQWQKHQGVAKGHDAAPAIGCAFGDQGEGWALVGIDADLPDGKVADAFAKDVMLPGLGVDNITKAGFPLRYGNKPKFAVLAKCKDTELRKFKSKKWVDGKGVEYQIEIFAEGSQMLLYGAHPTAGHYTYRMAGLEPLAVKLEDLPEVTGEQLHAMTKQFDELAPSLKLKPKSYGLKSERDCKPLSDVKDKQPDPNYTLAMARAELFQLDSDMAEDDWWRVGSALCFQGNGSLEWFELFDEWSERGDKYHGQSDDEIVKRWKSWKSKIGKPGKWNGIGTLRAYVKAAGGQLVRKGACSTADFQDLDAKSNRRLDHADEDITEPLEIEGWNWEPTPWDEDTLNDNERELMSGKRNGRDLTDLQKRNLRGKIIRERRDLEAPVAEAPEVPGHQDVFNWMTAPKLDFSMKGIPIVEVPDAVCRYDGALEREMAKLALTVGDAIYKTVPPPEMVEDLMAINEMSVLAGAPGSMKTMWGISLALALSNNREQWFDRYLLEASSVLWLAYEGVNAVRKRIAGYATRQIEIQPRMGLVTPRMPVTAPGFESYVYDLFCAMQRVNGFPPRWLVIDTFAQATPGINENEAADVGPVMAKLQRIAQQLQCHITLIHHGTKSGSSLIRGSSAIEGAVDTVFGVTSDRDRGNSTVTVEKQRNLDSYGKQLLGTLVINDLSAMPWWSGQWPDKRRKAPTAPMVAEYTRPLDEDSTLEDRYRPLQDALMEAVLMNGGVSIDGAQFNTIAERWLALAWAKENRELEDQANRKGKDFDPSSLKRKRLERARHAITAEGKLIFQMGAGRTATVIGVKAASRNAF